MNNTVLSNEITEETSYSILSKAESVFAAIWHNPKGAIATEQVAQYYGVSADEISELLQTHWDEFSEEIVSGWTPRAAIRLGMLLNSPTASEVRSLALDVIEAHKIPTKRASVEFLLKNASFVEWSDREIGRILKCDHKVVSDARKRLEAENKIVPINRRRCNRGGKTIEQNSNKTTQRDDEDSSSHLGSHSPDAPQNPDSIVERDNQVFSPHLGSTPQIQPSNPDSIVAKVRVSSPGHLRFGQEGTVTGNANSTHVFVAFPDCPSELIAIADLDSSSVPYPTSAQTYTEEELLQAIEQALIGRKVEIEEQALNSANEQLQASRNLVQQVKAENVRLQQQLEQLESLRLFEVENKRLQERNAELETLVSQKPMQWTNPIPSAAAKVLNQEVKKALKNTIDLQRLAIEPPKEDVALCLHLMTLALGNLAQAVNNTQALESAAILLGCEANKGAIASALEKPLLIEQALIDVRSAIGTRCTWEQFREQIKEYDQIKNYYWVRLTSLEQNYIKALAPPKSDASSDVPEDISPVQIGARVSHADQYSQFYRKQGLVVDEPSSDEVMVLWDDDKDSRPRRYSKKELRLTELQTV